jgi:hypothetical protein
LKVKHEDQAGGAIQCKEIVLSPSKMKCEGNLQACHGAEDEILRQSETRYTMWNTLQRLRDMPEFIKDRIFNFTAKAPTGKKLHTDKNFVQSFILIHRPIKERDIPGYVYIYCLEEHGEKIHEFINKEFARMNKVLFIDDGHLPWSKSKDITIDNLERRKNEIDKPWEGENTQASHNRDNCFDYDALEFDEDDKAILMKIGRSKNIPGERVRRQSKQNNEKYMIVQSFYSKHHNYLEWALHKFLRKNRVVRPDVEDGKTEWFLIGVRELVVSVWKVRRTMQVLFDDVALGYVPENQPPQLNGLSSKKRNYTSKLAKADNQFVAVKTETSKAELDSKGHLLDGQMNMKSFFNAPSIGDARKDLRRGGR